MADLIELAKQQADEISRAGHNGWGNTMAALVEALEAAREDASCMHRFAGMLLGGMNDIQDALGFTDEDKLCANGSAEIVAKIRELREDAERWRALREMDGVAIYALLGDCDGIHPEQADAAIDQARGKAGKEVGK